MFVSSQCVSTDDEIVNWCEAAKKKRDGKSKKEQNTFRMLPSNKWVTAHWKLKE